MSFQEQVEADIASILGGEFSEKVMVSGKTVNAVISRDPGPESGNEISSDGSSFRAVVYVAKSDYPSPQRGDLIQDEYGVGWRVIQSAPLPGLSRLVCVAEENPWG